jgi:hypothetical protein
MPLRQFTIPILIIFLLSPSLTAFGRAVLLQQEEASAQVQPLASKLTLRKIFHLVGVPGLKRDARSDLILSEREIVFQKGKKQLLALPYDRIHRVQWFSGERDYAKEAVIATAFVGTPGLLLFLKKSKVDTLVLDYLNERGGLMGIVIQIPQKQGASCKDWLARFQVVVEEPIPPPAAPPDKK